MLMEKKCIVGHEIHTNIATVHTILTNFVNQTILQRKGAFFFFFLTQMSGKCYFLTVISKKSIILHQLLKSFSH